MAGLADRNLGLVVPGFGGAREGGGKNGNARHHSLLGPLSLPGNMDYPHLRTAPAQIGSNEPGTFSCGGEDALTPAPTTVGSV